MRETDPYEHLAHLVAQAQTGDRNAFEEAYRLTAQAQFFSIAAKTNAEVAPDLLQEVYLTVWKNIAKIRPRSFVGYLNTVTHNVCLRHYERTSRPREIPHRRTTWKRPSATRSTKLGQSTPPIPPLSRTPATSRHC